MHLIHIDQLGKLLSGRRDTVSKTGVKTPSGSFLYNTLYTFPKCIYVPNEKGRFAVVLRNFSPNI